jgi:sialate O-acetylesterase
MPARPLLILSGLLAQGALAAPTIDPQFGTHSVIQRDKPIVLSGTALAGERLNVIIGDEKQDTAADANGRWRASFPPSHAGSLKIRVSASSGEASSDDVELGDVWLCSGQSNMEYPLRRALNGDGEVEGSADEDLRVMKIPEQLAPEPQAQFQKSPTWQRSAPDSVKDFSAACYFLARDLRSTEKVPIGAIDDTWGGTPIRAWMNEASLRSSGDEKAADIVELNRSDPAAAVRQFGAEWGLWWRSQTGDKLGAEPWNESGWLGWRPLPSLSYWDGWGPEWKAWIGAIWAREQVALTPAEAAQSATLALSAVDDIDQTFVNGIAVGGKNDPSNPRSYPVPRGVLKPGMNEILVYARNVWGQGGFKGPVDQFALTFSDGHSKPLASGWQYSKIADRVGQPPAAPWEGSSGVSTIYDAMVAPLGALGLKGVAWYQGESDVGQKGYDLRLGAWIANWRAQFRDPQLAFLIVGLAGWGSRVSSPVESGWAALINEQRLAVERDRNAALVSAIDLGEPNDIHPANKQEVGRRLSLAAHRLVYRDGGAVGPMPREAVLYSGNLVTVHFTKPLQALSGADPLGFELCFGAIEGCHFANAHINGSDVTIDVPDRLSPVEVRYAWADYPVVNLYDRDMLPVPVFKLPISMIVTGGRP